MCSRQPSGSVFTRRSITQNRAKIPPTPTTRATATTRRRLAWSSRTSPSAYRSASSTAPVSRSHQPSRPNRADRSLMPEGAGGEERPPPSGRSSVAVTPGPDATRTSRGGPGGLDVVQYTLERVRTVAHVLEHARPERTRADLGRHEVGGIEPTGTRLEAVGEDDRCVRQDVVGVAVGADVHVGRDARRSGHATHRALHRLVDEPLDEVHDLGTVA